MFKDIFKDVFSLNFIYEIGKNILTIIMIGIMLFITTEIYPIKSEYFLLFLLVFIGVLTYFGFSYLPKFLSKIRQINLK